MTCFVRHCRIIPKGILSRVESETTIPSFCLGTKIFCGGCHANSFKLQSRTSRRRAREKQFEFFASSLACRPPYLPSRRCRNCCSRRSHVGLAHLGPKRGGRQRSRRYPRRNRKAPR